MTWPKLQLLATRHLASMLRTESDFTSLISLSPREERAGNSSKIMKSCKRLRHSGRNKRSLFLTSSCYKHIPFSLNHQHWLEGREQTRSEYENVLRWRTLPRVSQLFLKMLVGFEDHRWNRPKRQHTSKVADAFWGNQLSFCFIVLPASLWSFTDALARVIYGESANAWVMICRPVVTAACSLTLS